jgi:preprotein translocase subunit SecA
MISSGPRRAASARRAPPRAISHSILALGPPPCPAAGPYRERMDGRPGAIARLLAPWKAAARLAFSARRGKRFLELVEAHGRAYDGRSAEEIGREASALRALRLRPGIGEDDAARCFALARAAAERTLGIRHRDVQVLGGWGLLRGMAVEMETGEGKTLTATLAACAAAVAGFRVHVLTANDYLARRDAAWMAPVYGALGLSAGSVAGGMAEAARRAAYSRDITYSTGKEAAFDYLRDRIRLGRLPSRLHLRIEGLSGGRCPMEDLILRGLEFAIVDELDSVLIDDARVPLIISRSEEAEETEAMVRNALALSERLEPGRHYMVRLPERRVEPTDAGRREVEALAASLRPAAGLWGSPRMRGEAILQALTARVLFRRDREYIVREGKVVVIDGNTGRTLPDRSWEQGLHQAIQVKEGCPVTPRDRPLAQISFQKFFRRYRHLSGMTGTARESARELAAAYGLPVLRIPPFRPSRRRSLGARVFSTAGGKEEAIVARVRDLHGTGRPVLVGTRSVESSERISCRLRAAGLPHRVLNARQDEEEAETIARAGEPGSITVATDMAGRGTDIRLHPGVIPQGGLHVISSEPHEASRTDRQLFGRCGRQGDPGSHEGFASIEDDLLANHVPRSARAIRSLGPGVMRFLLPWVGPLLIRRAQKAAERRHRRARAALLDLEEGLDEALAFAGGPEAGVRGGTTRRS